MAEWNDQAYQIEGRPPRYTVSLNTDTTQVKRAVARCNRWRAWHLPTSLLSRVFGHPEIVVQAGAGADKLGTLTIHAEWQGHELHAIASDGTDYGVLGYKTPPPSETK